MPFVFELITGFLVSATCCYATIHWATLQSFGVRDDCSMQTRHAVHLVPTPRIGGLALLLGFLAIYASLNNAKAIDSLSKEVTFLLRIFLISVVPVFIFGFIEDLSQRIKPRLRLLAAFVTSLISVLVGGYSLNKLGLPGVDILLTIQAFSIVVTVFCMAGIIHAHNIIDGLHGLASGNALISLIAFGLLSFWSSDYSLAWYCIFGVSIIFGFYIFNFPWGKIFLGDCGAYLIGLYISILAVALPARNVEISPWTSLCICILPFTETVFSIIRRKRRSRLAMSADRLHLHALLYRRLTPRFPAVFIKSSPQIRNSISGLLALLYASLGAAIALLIPNKESQLQLAFVFLVLIYWAAYARIVKFRWFLRKKNIS